MSDAPKTSTPMGSCHDMEGLPHTVNYTLVSYQEAGPMTYLHFVGAMDIASVLTQRATDEGAASVCSAAGAMGCKAQFNQYDIQRTLPHMPP